MNESIMFPLSFSRLGRRRIFKAFWLIVIFVLTFADCFTRGM